MFNAVKVFIELHKDLIAKEDWKKFYQAAYDVKLPNYQVEELLQVFEDCDITVATDVRNELLFDTIALNLTKARKFQDVRPNAIPMEAHYVFQFLGIYLDNLFGFTVGEAMELMWNNQKLLGIELTPTHKVSGQNGIQNYEITFVN